MIRGAIKWGINPRNVNEDGLFYPRGPLSPAHSRLFYEQGTIQNSWNTLYNEYCDRVRMYVTDEELEAADNRHVKWTKKDTGVETFCPIPSTKPT